MSDIKQVIVIRKDLKMRRGKEVSSGCHASMEFLKQKMGYYRDCRLNQEYCGERWVCELSEAETSWLSGIHKKICVTVNSESELDGIYEEAKLAGLEVHMVTDLGLTEFNLEPTKTCLAIGPDYSEKIDKITGKLPLY